MVKCFYISNSYRHRLVAVGLHIVEDLARCVGNAVGSGDRRAYQSGRRYIAPN